MAKTAREEAQKIIADNRKAHHDYHLIETFEAGVALLGTEVKSIREGGVQLIGKTVEKGMTLVPVRMYLKHGRIKVAISLAKGKKDHDKRETIKRREADRETRAAVKERR